MKSMLKKIGFLFIASCLVFSLSAQQGERGNRTPEEMANRQTERMTKDLNLNADQSAKVKVINLDYAKKFAEARADKEKGRENVRKLVEARNAELKTVLTEEQYKQWSEAQKKQRERRGNRNQ